MFVLATRVTLVIQAHKVQLVLREQLVLRGQLELKERLAHRELLAPRETRDRKVPRALRGL